MRLTFQDLKSMINEALGAFKMLDTVSVKIILVGDMKIEEIITDIRVIKGVATVTQIEPIVRTPGKRKVLTLMISFDPKDMDKMDYIDAMSRVMKKTRDVRLIVVKTLNGKPVSDASGERHLVY